MHTRMIGYDTTALPVDNRRELAAFTRSQPPKAVRPHRDRRRRLLEAEAEVAVESVRQGAQSLARRRLSAEETR
jgi:hypothetical protein